MNGYTHQLIQKYQNGDDKLLSELIEKFKPLIKKYKYLLNYEDAEEDLTLYFIQMLNKIPITKFPNTDSDIYVLSYIKKSMRNEYIRLSKQNQCNIKLISDDENIIENISDNRVDLDIKIIFESEINKLTDLQKQIIIYHYYYDLSISEIANKLNISRQAVNRIKLRALKLLRKNIENQDIN